MARTEEATKEMSGRASINVSRQTKNALDSIKHQGQSYDGLLQELVKFWEEKKSRPR